MTSLQRHECQTRWNESSLTPFVVSPEGQCAEIRRSKERKQQTQRYGGKIEENRNEEKWMNKWIKAKKRMENKKGGDNKGKQWMCNSNLAFKKKN